PSSTPPLSPYTTLSRSHGRAARGALPREPERGGEDAARAEGQRRPDGRGPQDGSDLAAAEEAHEQARGHEDGKDAGEDEPQQQEEGGLAQDRPRLAGDLEQEVAHARPPRRRRRPGAGRVADPRRCEWTAWLTLYLGRYFLSSAQATEYCGSTTLAILMTAVWPRSW